MKVNQKNFDLRIYFLDTIVYIDEDILVTYNVNPVLRLFYRATDEFGLEIFDEIVGLISHPIMTRIGDMKIIVSYDLSRGLWKARYENEEYPSASIEMYMLYPFALNFYGLICSIYKRIKRANIRAPSLIKGIIGETINTRIPALPYYEIKTDMGVVRFSKYVLEFISEKKILPSLALAKIFERDLHIISTDFKMIELESDVILTYLIMRELMPPYLIISPRKLSKNIIKMYYEDKVPDSVPLVIPIEDNIEVLSKIYRFIKPKCGGRDLNPRRHTPRDLESGRMTVPPV